MIHFQLPTDWADYLDLVLPPAGGLLAAWRNQTGPHTAGLWTAAGGPPVWTVTGEYVGLSPDAGWVAVFDKAVWRVQVYEAGGTKPVAAVPCRYDSGYVGSAVAPGGGELAVVYGNDLLVYALPAGTVTVRKPRVGSWSPTYSACGRWLVCPTERAVRLFDRTRKWKVTRLLSVRHAIGAAAGDRGLATGPDGQTVTVWDLTDNSAAVVLAVGDWVTAVALSPDGRRVLTADADEVTLWDAAGGRLTRYDWGLTPIALAFAPDGLTAAAGGADGRVVVWDVDG